MSRGLRILHIADSHIGAGMPDRPRKSGRRRGDDIIDSYRRVLQRAREFDVDLVLHAGDVFDRPDPSPSLIAVACEPLLSLAADGIPVVVTPGNHERSILPNSLLLSHQNVYILARPRTIVLKLRGCRVAVTGMPCIRRQSAQRFPAALAETNWEAAKADCRVLLLHQTIESATCGPAGYRFRSGEDVIERDAIPAAFDYVALGHIHRMQCLEPTLFDGAPLVYAGSPDRISFAERDEPKGCMLVEERGGGLAARFLEHDVRPMRIVALDVTGLRRDELVNAVSESVASLPPRALARVRLTGRATRDVVRGLRLARHCCELRPDASVAVSMEAVEFVPNRALRRSNEARSSA
ncbi:MAG: DNA repair exonuclease, partial [Planctomycetota bacterium]